MSLLDFLKKETCSFCSVKVSKKKINKLIVKAADGSSEMFLCRKCLGIMNEIRSLPINEKGLFDE